MSSVSVGLFSEEACAGVYWNQLSQILTKCSHPSDGPASQSDLGTSQYWWQWQLRLAWRERERRLLFNFRNKCMLTVICHFHLSKPLYKYWNEARLPPRLDCLSYSAFPSSTRLVKAPWTYAKCLAGEGLRRRFGGQTTQGNKCKEFLLTSPFPSHWMKYVFLRHHCILLAGRQVQWGC